MTAPGTVSRRGGAIGATAIHAGRRRAASVHDCAGMRRDAPAVGLHAPVPSAGPEGGACREWTSRPGGRTLSGRVALTARHPGAAIGHVRGPVRHRFDPAPHPGSRTRGIRRDVSRRFRHRAHPGRRVLCRTQRSGDRAGDLRATRDRRSARHLAALPARLPATARTVALHAPRRAAAGGPAAAACDPGTKGRRHGHSDRQRGGRRPAQARALRHRFVLRFRRVW